MDLPGPLEKYLAGENPTHTSRKRLAERVGMGEEQVQKLLQSGAMVTPQGKITRKARESGLVDLCEGRALWNVQRARAFLRGAQERHAQSGEPSWVDLGTVGTYFGASSVQVGKWLDQLALRATPTMERNTSGDHDMLDVARRKQREQAVGFIAKEPTEKALEMGAARKITVTNRKQQEIEITQWNLQLLKDLLVRAGHPLDTEHKMTLRGKGKNSNVKVGGVEERAKELYVQWAQLHQDPASRWKIKKLFSGQPRLLLQKVEEDFMKMPGYLTQGRYLKDC